jgi:cholera toxin transcriptional activator
MSAGTACRIFRFGAFEVNESEGELRKNGIRIKLHAQPFQVLMALLEKPSELVTRDDIRNRLWGEDTFVDFDHGLNTAVNKIRQALSDSAAEPRYIETVSGKGYRFIAPVVLAAAERQESVSGAKPPEAGKPPAGQFLAAPHELPGASRNLVRTLLLLEQVMYLAFYVGSLANLPEIRGILDDAKLPLAFAAFSVLVGTAAALIPVRLFLCAAVAFDLQQLPAKFGKLFPVLLPLDLLWALSPFLLIHHIDLGLAIGMCAALLYAPFAQRSLILMYASAR